MYRKKIFIAVIGMLSTSATFLFAQDELVKKTSENKSDSVGFQFTQIINLERTAIENQGSAGTCWSYATNSFLESEMIKAGKQPLHLAKIFTARNSYFEKAQNYIRMGGSVNYGDGGEPHDAVNMYAKYGTMPESVYTGLINGATKHNFNKMQKSLKAMLDSILKVPSGKVDIAWKKNFNDTLDAYLGKVPETFEYEGKTYTPLSFAKERVGLNPDDYIEFISQNNTPYWKMAMMMIPDNWAFQWCWNIPSSDFITIIDYALKSGYTVAWATDASEPYFSWPNGVAFVPENPEKYRGRLTKEEKLFLFGNPKQEPIITAEFRQQGIENNSTTDDHDMHIVGLAKDQNGKEYYIVKNSWGESNEYKGFIYVSKAYVQYKSIGVMVNKKALPKSITSKIKL